MEALNIQLSADDVFSARSLIAELRILIDTIESKLDAAETAQLVETALTASAPGTSAIPAPPVPGWVDGPRPTVDNATPSGQASATAPADAAAPLASVTYPEVTDVAPVAPTVTYPELTAVPPETSGGVVDGSDAVAAPPVSDPPLLEG